MQDSLPKYNVGWCNESREREGYNQTEKMVQKNWNHEWDQLENESQEQEDPGEETKANAQNSPIRREEEQGIKNDDIP